MYRGNNNYPDNPTDNPNNISSISPYSPHNFKNHKMDIPLSSNPSLSFYDPSLSLIPQNQYQYPPPIALSQSENFDPISYWQRETPQSRGPSMHMHGFYQRPPHMNESYMQLQKPSLMNYPDVYKPQPQPQMNILQKISFLIKPQLPQLQKIMSKIIQRKHESRSRRSPSHQRQRQRERSRQKDRYKKSSQWMCSRCSFLNFEWRDKCKKCNQSRQKKNNNSRDDDWKCRKCDNLNYARRTECYRCKSARNR